MCFFGTRVESGIYQGAGGVYFVTSEKCGDEARHFTVRQFLPETAKVETVNPERHDGKGSTGFAAFTSRRTAERIASALAGEAPRVNRERHLPDTPQAQFLRELQEHGSPEADENLARWLMLKATAHLKYCEILCNGGLLRPDGTSPYDKLPQTRERELREWDMACAEKRKAETERQIRRKIAQRLPGVGALFSGDPRGATFKLVWPDGESNSWGGKGWVVPCQEES